MAEQGKTLTIAEISSGSLGETRNFPHQILKDQKPEIKFKSLYTDY